MNKNIQILYNNISYRIIINFVSRVFQSVSGKLVKTLQTNVVYFMHVEYSKIVLIKLIKIQFRKSTKATKMVRSRTN